mgnify:CR=1 FL=1
MPLISLYAFFLLNKAGLKKGVFSFAHQGQRPHFYDTSVDFKKSHEEMMVKGTGNIDGFKSQFEIEENYTESARIVSKKKIKGAGRLKGLWEMLPAYIQAQLVTDNQGRVSLSFYSEKDKNDVEKIEIDLNLKDTEVFLPLFNWRKRRGDPGSFELDLDLAQGHIRHFKKLSFVGPGLNMTGKAEFGEDGKISGINLSPFAVNDKKGQARAHFWARLRTSSFVEEAAEDPCPASLLLPMRNDGVSHEAKRHPRHRNDERRPTTLKLTES